MFNMIKGKKCSILKSHPVSNFSKLKTFLLVIFSLRSMGVYWFWNKGILSFGCALILFFVWFVQMVSDGYSKTIEKQSYIICLLGTYTFLYFYLFVISAQGLSGIIVTMMTEFFPVFVFILSTKEEKINFLKQITDILSIILFFSFIEYALVSLKVLNINPIHFTSPFPAYEYFLDYGFYIVVSDVRNFFIVRFQSVFMEPGHLGMMSSLLLYANKYNLRDKRNVIILISAIFTMSLVAYVLLVVGFFIFCFFSSKKKIRMLSILIVVSMIIGIGGMTYYKLYPDSGFSEAILSRLVFDKKKGISGNNRTLPAFKKAFHEQMSELNKDFLFGYGENDKRAKGSSASVFIFKYGITGLLFVINFYIAICLSKKSPQVFGFFILYAISFLQRPYATWFSQIAIMISSADVFRIEKMNR